MRPSWRCSVKIGMCAAMMISIENSVGRPTSTAASRIRLRRRSSSSASWSRNAAVSLRKMFSTTITAPSTMMPKSIAPSESRLAGTPMKLRPRKVASSASGMVTATLAAAHQHHAGDDVIVVVLAGDALPRHGANRDLRDILHQDRRAAPLGDDDVADVVGPGEQADAADEILLATLLDVAAAGIGIAALDRLRELRQRDLVVAHPRGIRPHFVLLHQAAERHDVGDPGHHPQLPAHHPVLIGAQLAR